MTSVNPAVISHDREFERLVEPGEPLQQLASGCTWSEGPVYLPKNEAVLWSDIPNNRIMCWSGGQVSVHANEVEFTNGHTLDVADTSDAIYSCSHGNRRIERRQFDGTVTTVVDAYEGKRLNSPNDLVVKSDGTIWFTDPPYGIASDDEGHKAESELGSNNVFRYDPQSGQLTIVIDSMGEPNGLAFSPDEQVLYVSDTSAALRNDGTGAHHIMAYDIVDGTRATGGRVFAEVDPGLPDGFRVAETGHIFTSSSSGIQVYTNAATLVGRIEVPEKTSNCVFGGPDGRTLYITATTSLYAIQTKVRGSKTSMVGTSL